MRETNGVITESMLLDNIDKGIFDPNLVGRTVKLIEGSHTHEWLIVRVNDDSYDLWYNDSIGTARWALIEGACGSWTNNDHTNDTLIRGLCTAYKSKLSSEIQARLMAGLNANCGSDTVVVLSARQLGYTDTDPRITNDDNSNIDYFNSNDRRSIGFCYWTSSAHSDYSYHIWCVESEGTFFDKYYRCRYDVVPAIRVG